MNIVYVTRISPDWEQMDLETFFKQPFNELERLKLKDVIRKWDSLIQPQFFEFKEEVAKIHIENREKLEANYVFTTSENLEEQLRDIPKPFIVIFSDEDGWHNPTLKEMLKTEYFMNPTLEAIVWDRIEFINNKKHLNNKTYFKQDKTDNFQSNTVALTDRFFATLTDEDRLFFTGDGYLPYSHILLNKYKNKIRHTWMHGKFYSIFNSNLSSYNFWYNKNMGTFQEVGSIVQFFTSYYPDIAEDIDWAKTEVYKMIQLYNKFKMRKSFL